MSQSLPPLLRQLKLPAFVDHHEEMADKAVKEGWTYHFAATQKPTTSALEKPTRLES